MILVILLIGVLFVAASGRDKVDELLEIIKSDFTGKNNFLVWAIAIGGIYSLGYIKPLSKFASSFVILILIAVVVRKTDKDGNTFFVSLINQIRSTEL